MLFLSSWAILQGPWTYGAHLLSGQRLPFTAAYFGSIILTLYFSLGVRYFIQVRLWTIEANRTLFSCNLQF